MPSGKPPRTAPNEWSWLKRYRVWDANRKIFVFPENCIEPESRLPKLLQAALRKISDCIAHDCGSKARTHDKGISVLLVGRSRLRALTATQMIARNLDLDLYHVDLSQVVSRYIGETEKNLSQIFATAERLMRSFSLMKRIRSSANGAK